MSTNPPSIHDNELSNSGAEQSSSHPDTLDDGVEYVTVRIPIYRHGLPPVRMSDKNLSGRISRDAGQAVVSVKAALLRLSGEHIRVTQKSVIGHVFEAINEAIRDEESQAGNIKNS